MPKFVFKLDPLLEHRRRIERDHQVHVAAVESERAELEGRLRKMAADADASRVALRSSLGAAGSTMPHRVDTHATRWQAAAAMSSDAKARTIAVQLAGVLKRLEDARGLLTEAAKERRAVERLRERRLDAFNRRIAEREARDLDDLNTARSAHAAYGA